MLTTYENYQDYPKLSQSELYALNRCKKMHDYSYNQGLVSRSVPDYLTKGSFFHLVMAEILRGRTDINALTMEMQAQQLKEREATVNEVIRGEIVMQLTDFWNDVGFPDPDSILAVEEEFYVDLGWRTNDDTPVLFHGVVDGVVRDDEGNLWIVEHKTAGRAWSQSQFQFAYQGKLYAEAWERLTGERPIGVQYNFFYPKRWEIRNQYITSAESQLIIQEIQHSIALRDVLSDTGIAPREPKWGCGDCKFRDLCFAELVGQDAGYIRETQFTVDEKRIR